jgi:hypothetical protein
MDPMRTIALLCAVALVAGLAACASEPAGGAQEMACCKTTAELKAQLPKCCVDNADCCKAKTADCCKKAADLTAKMPECCKKHAAGTPQDCCKAK